MSDDHQSDTPIYLAIIFLLLAAAGGCFGAGRVGPDDQQCQDYREVGGC